MKGALSRVSGLVENVRRPRKGRVSRAPKTRRIPRAFRIAGTVVVGVIVLALAVVAYDYTGRPSTCAACHELTPDVESYRKSLHAEVGCYDCHANPGAMAKIASRFGLVSDVYAHVTGSFTKPLNADGKLAGKISDTVCERCHSPKRVASPRRGVIIDHAAHKKKNIPCVRCHNRVAHPLELTAQYLIRERISATIPYRDGTKMASCMECHVGGAGNPPNDCAACHPQQFKLPYNCASCHTESLEQLKPQSHFAPNYAETIHESLAKSRTTYCYECHMRSFCEDCHKKRGVTYVLPAQSKPQFHKPRSHYEPTFLPSGHGDEAKEQGKEVCYQCHTEKFCNDCHGGLEMPHPESFKPEHGKIMEKLGYNNSCVRCHPNRNQFCESGCHHRGWDPSLGPLDRSHPQVVKVNNGVGYCLVCHTSVFCAVCHVTGKKTNMFRK